MTKFHFSLMLHVHHELTMDSAPCSPHSRLQANRAVTVWIIASCHSREKNVGGKSYRGSFSLNRTHVNSTHIFFQFGLLRSSTWANGSCESNISSQGSQIKSTSRVGKWDWKEMKPRNVAISSKVPWNFGSFIRVAVETGQVNSETCPDHVGTEPVPLYLYLSVTLWGSHCGDKKKKIQGFVGSSTPKNITDLNFGSETRESLCTNMAKGS